MDDALTTLKDFPYTDLGFAKIDHHREVRTGYPEIVYCAGKTIEQVKEIFRVKPGQWLRKLPGDFVCLSLTARS